MKVNQDEKEFATWVLEVGNGEATNVDTLKAESLDKDYINIDKQLMLLEGANSMEEIQKATFPNLENFFQDRAYLQGRGILTPKNETVDDLNHFILTKISGDMKEYLSADNIVDNDNDLDGASLFYTTEYLNALKCSGLPNHQLSMKQYAPIILLRNIIHKEGLCNGTRLLVTRLGERVLGAEVLTGTNVGKKVIIPRIIMTTAYTDCPYKMRRRQFPVRVCYAMTINKSQGQSLQNVGIYLPKPVFSHGQLYVVLSRVTSKKDFEFGVKQKTKTISH